MENFRRVKAMQTSEKLQKACIQSLQQSKYAKARELRMQSIITWISETALFQDLAEIVFFFENKYKFTFQRINLCDDNSYIVYWHETDKYQENLRVNHMNNWLHEKVQPLTNDLPAAVSRYGLVLDELIQYSSGKFTLRMISPDGLKLYTKYQTFRLSQEVKS